MGSHYNGKERKLYEPKIPHFFKIILQESVDAGRIISEIPRKFVVNYGNDLPDHIFLQVPSGTLWKVDLVKSDGHVYLQNGWRKFQQYYCIAHGTLLSFEYRSRSFFQVIVYDRTATEIVYPYDDDDCKEPAYRAEDKEARTGLNVENIPEVDVYLQSSSKRRKNSPLPCSRPPKMGRTGDTSGSARKSTKSRNCRNLGRNASIPNESTAFKESAGSELETPSFSVVMQPAYTSGNYMNLNINFARKYLMQNRCNVTLQNSEKRTWTVGYVLYNAHNLARLASGWSEFVRDNDLVPGTNCVFELIDKAKLVFNFRITQASVRPYSPELQSEDSCKDRGKQQFSGNKRKLSKKLLADLENDALSRATPSCQPENLFLRVGIKPTYIRTRLDVPFKFARRYFKKNDCPIVLQNAGGRAWNVFCRINSKAKQAYLRNNWVSFIRDNNVKVGDVCTFELTKSTVKLVMKVSIVRAGSMDGSTAPAVDRNVCRGSMLDKGFTPNSNEVEVKCDPDGNSAGKQQREKSDRQLSDRLSTSWIHKTVEAAERSYSMHPCFKATMKFNNLLRNVSVPAKFAEILKLGPDNASILKLQVGKKRWPVKLHHSPERKTWRLTSGWAEFSKENLLKVGEICAFELVGREYLLVKVTIFRHNA